LLVYWLILEISLMLFLPIILNNKFGYEIRIKYFLVQVVGSFLIIYIFIYCIKYLYLFRFILFFKMGISPFFFWGLYVSEKIEYFRFFFFLRLLKVIPFIILSILYLKIGEGLLFIFINCLVGSLGGLGRLCLRKLIFYSSLGHRGWVLRCISIFDYLWFRYFFIYILIFLCLIYIIFFIGAYKVIDIKRYSIKNFFTVILLLTFRGLPPFSIFMMKFYVVLILLDTYLYIIILILIFRSLLRLYYYLRVRLDYYIFFNYKKIFNRFTDSRFVIILIFLLNFFLIIGLRWFIFI